MDVCHAAHGIGRDVGPTGAERLAVVFYTVRFADGIEVVFFSCTENCSSSKERTTGPIRRAKGGWTQEEDEKLGDDVKLFNGKCWKKIAAVTPLPSVGAPLSTIPGIFTGMVFCCIGCVCSFVTQLAECISRSKQELDASPLVCTVIAHAGDGNFHTVILFDPNRKEQCREAARLNHFMVHAALSMEGIGYLISWLMSLLRH